MVEPANFGLAVAFLNAGSALEEPLAAARWWGAARSSAVSVLPLGEVKPRFDAALAAELQGLRDAPPAIFTVHGHPFDVPFGTGPIQ